MALSYDANAIHRLFYKQSGVSYDPREAYVAEHRMKSCYTVFPDTPGAIAVDCYPKSTILSLVILSTGLRCI